MNRGHFRLAEQVNNVGYFAEVKLTLVRDPESPELIIHWNDACDRKYKEAVQFGLMYAWEGMSLKDRGRSGAIVTVEEVGWAPIDSSSVTIAYATINAFYIAIGSKPTWRLPMLDTQKQGIFFRR
jgi:hypothetical protein